MKTLQNNFTTPEQSNRLLELGVPADSADCYLLRTLFGKGDTFIVEVLHDELYSKKDKFTNMLEYLPCWSVGRLIEIIGICHQPIPTEMRIATSNIIEYLLDIFDTITDGSGFDFSKLEE